MRLATAPNILLNMNPQEASDDVIESLTDMNQIQHIQPLGQLISGDWGSLPDVLSSTKEGGVVYDLILASEVLYSPASYTKLINIFYKLLKRSGRVFLASKATYFGCGGDVHQFLQCLYKADPVLDENGVEWRLKCEPVVRVDHQHGNSAVSREILSIYWTCIE